MSYTDVEEFYGRAAYEAGAASVPWGRLSVESQAHYVRAALAARAAVYIDPAQQVANKLFEVVNGGPPSNGGSAGNDYLKMARAAIAMGAKP